MGSPSTRDGDRVFILNKHGRIMKSVEESSLKLGRKNSKEARFKHYIGFYNLVHPPDQIWLEWAVEIIEQQLGLHQQLQTTALSKPNAWFPPPLDVLLINTDAALKPGEWGCGLSAVIRNYAGELMVAEVVYIHGCLSVQMAEAAAINLGIQLALRRSIQKARVGSDCQSIIKALNSNLNVPTDWGQMVMDINQLKIHFQNLSFTYYLRKCNQVANSLAKWSLETQQSIVLTDLLLPCAAAFLIADVPNVA
ncbi:hypothetical protein F8388_023968 [Cannabis sativa]|uniref:RNase H type-1 domain-containing protein n=1 Tax=Cannabis sativa TaxID=3483 RepID=A0A7J6HVI9_CANSA|nr:hypothetical protein F8388_023968 [Cannabis sativa]KAF4399226.1 hypothetical protein G4B88_022309 [Cannabis sativa]